MTRPLLTFTRALGQVVIDAVVKLGYGARLFALLLGQSGLAFRRLQLTIAQVHFIGNYSLVIIVVSGLFVGFVLGLQGYNTLQRYGSEQALGLLVALSLVARTRSGDYRIAVCGTGGYLHHRRNWSHEGR